MSKQQNIWILQASNICFLAFTYIECMEVSENGELAI